MGVAAFRKMSKQRGDYTPSVPQKKQDNICPKCGQEKGKTGFAVHVKFCKG